MTSQRYPVAAQVASGPHSELLNQEALFLCKGDIFSGETKTQKEPTSVMVGAVMERSRLQEQLCM